MASWIRRQGPAFAVACLALMVALGGSVYAAAKIDGHQIKRGSLPGNRLERASLPGNRLKPGTLGGGRIAPGSLTGVQVDAGTLGKVPEASRADSANTAHTANSAIVATAASEASRLNGHVAACMAAQMLFAGACWEVKPAAAMPALQAAAVCASRGGELPAAMTLAAFGRQLGVELASGGEWSRDVSVVSAVNQYGVVTVSESGAISSDLHQSLRPFRCVIPLVS
ncbi:MAG TPA: hypothetical protein VEB65_11100 [Solirubrobacterales bacterium]|nr:hypothetical protein [Solirubrobacterales bacterium]